MDQGIKSAYGSLPFGRKMTLLAQWALDITVAARAAYPRLDSEHDSVQRLIAFNEIEEAITGQLVPMLREDRARYPDDVFIDIVLSKARHHGCECDVVRAFERAMSVN